MLRMPSQAGVANPLHLGLVAQKIGQGQRISTVLAHP
jgi:hypothetical protein